MLTVKITSVFYDNEGYPFKDAQRTVRYPITGGTFVGSHNTKQIRFYVRDIGGTTNISWVVISKLPNGKLGYEVCSNIGYDEELDEYYLIFDLSAYYTSVKGDLYLALRGYEGEVEFEDDDSDGVYNIVGDPLIEVTGTIKLSINYSPMVDTGTRVLPTEIDRLIAALNGYIKNADGIVVLSTLSDDISKYTSGQLFFVKSENAFYIKSSGTLSLFTKYITKYLYSDYNITTTTTLEQLYAIIGENPCFIEYGTSSWTNWYLCKLEKTTSAYSFQFINQSNEYRYVGTLSLAEGSTTTLSTILDNSESNTYFKPYATQKWTKQNFIPNVALTTTLATIYNTYGNKVVFANGYSNNNYISGYIYVYQSGGGYRVTGICIYGANAKEIKQTNTIYQGSTTVQGIFASGDNIATEDYVDSAIADFLQNEYSKVDTTTYPTLDDFLESTGEEGFIYLYPINVSDESKGYYQYIWENSSWVSLGTTSIDLSGYVEKTTSANKVYGTNELGAQTTYTVDDFHEGNIARRDTDGSITVPLTPTQNGHASSKKYVDDEISDLSNEVDNKLDEKANVDGNYPTLTAGLADNFTPYSEDSGAEQENPFISNGTGTNNNTEIVTVGDYGLLKEKQGNTIGYCEWFRNPNFSDGTSNWTAEDGDTLTVSDGIASITLVSTGTTRLRQDVPTIRTTINYLFKAYVKVPSTSNVCFNQAGVLFGTKSVTANTWTEVSWAGTGKNTYGTLRLQFDTSEMNVGDVIQIKYVYLIQLNKWYNDDIPQDLLDHPDHFSWYYNGSLAYNTGTLVNANGVKLVSTGRNIYNPNEPYNVVIPNKPFFASKTTTITYYDKDKNVISTENVSAGNTFTTPSNCVFINLSVSAITITPYYTDQEGGEGYLDSNNVPIEYPYEAPYIVDTGTEVLRRIPVDGGDDIIDTKALDGTITRRVGRVNLGNLNWSYSDTSGHEEMFSQSVLSDLKPVANNQKIKGFCARYDVKTANQLYSHEQMGIAVNTDGRIYVYSSDMGTSGSAFKTAMSGVYFYYELATPSTEQGTPFAENLPINDYGMLYWLDENDNLVGIPQGAKIFFPTNYKGFVDDMYSRVGGDSSDYALNSELNAKFETYLKSLSGYDATKTQTLKNVNGTFTWVDDD